MWRKLLVLLLLLLSGCATNEEWRRYRPLDSMAGGYAHYRLSKDTYQVYYITNIAWLADKKNNEYSDKANTFLYYTAADLTFAAGYDYFVELNKASFHERRLDPSFRLVVVNDPGWNDIHVLTIKMGKGKMPSDIKRGYNAHTYEKLMGLQIQAYEYQMLKEKQHD